MDQIERHGDLAVHLLAALSRSQVPIDRSGISQTSLVILHSKLPVMEVGWAIDGVAVARDSTRWELRWLNEIGRRSESMIDSCTASKTAIALRGRRLFALTHCECKIGRRKMREGTSDCGRGRTMLAPASSGVRGAGAPNGRARPIFAEQLGKYVNGRMPQGLQEKESTRARYEVMRCCTGADWAGARGRAGAGEAAFYDALTREGGEPVRMGKTERTRKGHAAQNELGRGE